MVKCAGSCPKTQPSASCAWREREAEKSQKDDVDSFGERNFTALIIYLFIYLLPKIIRLYQNTSKARIL